ncbi:MAG: hypothetical protein JETCAE04_25840 [Candidatus Jettenia caeni]|nr:MAG: hypothetical protein JETCAE04_25840 [Candidatus Jettenia caeni]
MFTDARKFWPTQKITNSLANIASNTQNGIEMSADNFVNAQNKVLILFISSIENSSVNVGDRTVTEYWINLFRAPILFRLTAYIALE